MTDDERPDRRQRHIDVANQFHEAVLSGTPIGQIEGLAAAVSYRLGLVVGLEEMRAEERRCHAELNAEAFEMHRLLARCVAHRSALPAELAAQLEQWRAGFDAPPDEQEARHDG